MKSLHNLGPLEREIMNSIWDTNEVTVREVHSRLKKKRDVAYTTVMTVMARLVGKEFLIRKKQGKAYL